MSFVFYKLHTVRSFFGFFRSIYVISPLISLQYNSYEMRELTLLLT